VFAFALLFSRQRLSAFALTFSCWHFGPTNFIIITTTTNFFIIIIISSRTVSFLNPFIGQKQKLKLHF